MPAKNLKPGPIRPPRNWLIKRVSNKRTLTTGVKKPIGVVARDDFEVVAVTVAVLTVQRGIMERGDAQRDVVSGDWVYLTQAPPAGGQALLVKATAFDRPGHSGRPSLVWWLE